MGKILQLSDLDRSLIYDECPYLDAPIIEGEPDIGIHIGLHQQTHIESPIDLDLFYHYKDTRMWIGSIMRDPANIWWTVKTLLGIQLEPFQVVILQELWNKPFPMLVGSRGMSKCAHGDTWVVKSDGFAQIKDIVDVNLPYLTKDYKTELSLLGENGFNPVEYSWNNGYSKTIQMKTSCGYSLEGTLNHPIRVVRDGQISWINMEDVRLGDYVPIHRGTEWFPNTNNITIDEAYLMGLLVGDGGYTVRGRISFTTADQQLLNEVNRISSSLWNKQFKKQEDKKYTYNMWGVSIWDELFQKYGFNSSVCGEKDIPSSILGARKEVVAAFIRGLADTDGCVHEKQPCVQFTAKSKRIIKSLQFLLTKFGIISTFKKRLNKKYNRYYYYLYIRGKSIQTYKREIGFGLSRKQALLEKIILKNTNTNIDILPHTLILNNLMSLRDKYVQIRNVAPKGYNYERQLLSPSRLKKYQLSYDTLKKILNLTNCLSDEPEWRFLNEIYHLNYFYDRVTKLEEGYSETYDVYIPNDHSFISNGFISHNSFLLALYIVLRCVLTPGCQIAVIGFGLRQSRNLYEYVEKFWRKAPLLQEMVRGDKRSGPKHEQIRSTFIFGESICMFLPLGHSGATIRGIRAQYIIIDEYGDVPKSIVDTVVAGFGAVSGDPIEKRNLLAKIRRLKASGDWDKNKEVEMAKLLQCNQMVLSGTAKFHFNHFAQDWIRHKTIIGAGTKDNLMRIWDVKDRDKVPEPSLYSVMRIPYELIPEGIMQKEMILNIQTSSSKAVFEQEYQAVFSDDSDGFFKARVIYNCTANNAIKVGNKTIEPFDPILKGDPRRKYILGFDPAAEQDNAAIVILELHDDHARVVYCWAINKKIYEREILAEEGITYHKYLAKKIAYLHSLFNFSVLSFDAQGGGKSVAEILEREQDILPAAMMPLLPVVEGHILWDGKEKPSDEIDGQHIIELVEFGNAKWNSEAHYGLRTDMEQKKLIFPRYDSLSINVDDDEEYSIQNGGELEISQDIEELKYELTIIEHTRTPGGNRERWDTPEVKQDNDKKGRLRNDRVSALVLANMAARRIRMAYPETDYFSEFTSAPKKVSGPWKRAPLWFKQAKGSPSIGVFKMVGD